MKKATTLKYLNIILAILFINQALSGYFSTYIQEYSYDLYTILHKNLGTVFICTVVLHFILNWNWVKATFFKKKKT